MTEEIWADLRDYPNHQVSSLGRVRNKRNGYVLKPFADRYGYLRLSIGNADNVYIHRLVCETFHGEPVGDRTQVNHIDCNRQNNCVDNLEWCNGHENISWGVSHGFIDPSIGCRRAQEVNRKRVRIVETGDEFESVKSCAEYFGVAPTNISRVLVGSRVGQRFHGYHLEFC